MNLMTRLQVDKGQEPPQMSDAGIYLLFISAGCFVCAINGQRKVHKNAECSSGRTWRLVATGPRASSKRLLLSETSFPSVCECFIPF